MILADRGFARTSFFAWLNAHGLDYVVRLNKRTCLTESDGRCWKLGEEGTQPGWLEWAPDVRYALYHGRPTEVVLNVALLLEGFQKPGEESSPQTASGAVVSGHEPP